ncbi:MAG: sodium:proton antiporter, partial [Oscillospiraceae bacterium]|nr:sodium:proton antiporter [Oscillospiraceae bacterium]
MAAVVFAVFFAALVFCLVRGASIAWALLLLLAGLLLLGHRRGFGRRALWDMLRRDLPKSMIVLRVLAYIGVLTGLWRTSGTIAFFIYHGVSIISPHLFILITFLLTALLSYALGTSFGVASTAGVVMMALARSG